MIGAVCILFILGATTLLLACVAYDYNDEIKKNDDNVNDN